MKVLIKRHYIKILIIIIILLLSSQISLSSTKTGAFNEYFFNKYEKIIYGKVNKLITTDLLLDYFNCYNKDNYKDPSEYLKDRDFPLLDTGCHYKIDLSLKNHLYFDTNFVVVCFDFNFFQNCYNEKIKISGDSILFYTQNGIEDFQNIYNNKMFYRNGLIAFDTINYQIRFICGTSNCDKVENEYFNKKNKNDFKNFIQIKYYCYLPEIIFIDNENKICKFYSNITKKKYLCYLIKKIIFYRKDLIQTEYEINFKEI